MSQDKIMKYQHKKRFFSLYHHDSKGFWLGFCSISKQLATFLKSFSQGDIEPNERIEPGAHSDTARR